VKKGRWVAVFWEDIVGVERPWLTHQETLELTPAPMVTLGVLLHQNKHYITVASTLEIAKDPDHFGSVCCIPRGVVRAMVEVSVPTEVPKGA
jgi:hypothetical protein